MNTASMSGLVGMSGLGLYCASKFAVVGLSESLSRELAPLGVGVSVLCPMMVDTPLNQNSARAQARARGEAEPDVGDDISIAATAAALRGGVADADAVAARVLRGIENGDLYILTHPEQGEFLRRRAEKLAAAVPQGLVQTEKRDVT